MSTTIEMSPATAKMVEALQTSHKSMREAVEAVKIHYAGTKGTDEVARTIYTACEAYQESLYEIMAGMMKDNLLDTDNEEDTICKTI